MSKAPKKPPRICLHVWVAPEGSGVWTRWHGGGRADTSIGLVIGRAVAEAGAAAGVFNVIVAPEDTRFHAKRMELTRKGEPVRSLWTGRFELTVAMLDRPEDFDVKLGTIAKGGEA